MTFLNPLDALIPKIPFSFFPDFCVWVTSEARGSVSVGFWGSCQLSPFWGGVRPEGSIDPPPPRNENPASPVLFGRRQGTGCAFVEPSAGAPFISTPSASRCKPPLLLNVPPLQGPSKTKR